LTFVREEQGGDIAAIRRVNELAFGQTAEADLVDTLRREGAVAVSLVAEVDGAIVGHILFSPVEIRSARFVGSGVGLGPMSVLPSLQRRGIGSALVREALRRCRAAGRTVVVVLGHAEYYPRFGFRPAGDFGLRSEYEVKVGERLGYSVMRSWSGAMGLNGPLTDPSKGRMMPARSDMARRLRLVSLLGLLLATTSAAQSPRSGQPVPDDAVARFARSSNGFGLDLYRQLRAKPGNLVVSPASVTTALAMAWGGARGKTAEEMQAVLRFDRPAAETMQVSGRLAATLTDPSRPVTFRIANRLFGEQTYRFERAYLESTRTAYGAPLEPLDFRRAAEPARERINGWVEEQTERRIRDLVPPGSIDRDTRLVLVNAIYFLGDWAAPFAKEATRPAPFHTSRSDRKDVPTMQQTESFRFVEKDGVKALELPYRGHGMSMLLVLPDQVDGLEAVERSLTEQRLHELVAALTPERVAVALPKFEVNPAQSLSLGDTLRTLGMTRAFDRQQADFTGIAQTPDPADRLFLARVFHKAFVRVDEKGTEAAAATAGVMVMAAAPLVQPPKEFRADHPFLFCIRDTASGLILFLGRVAEPSAG
jgi:serpin B